MPSRRDAPRGADDGGAPPRRAPPPLPPSPTSASHRSVGPNTPGDPYFASPTIAPPPPPPTRWTPLSPLSPRALRDFARARARRFVLGDERASLRAALRDELRRPPRVLLRDKVLYTLGVLNLVATEAVLLAAPQYFSLWYAAWVLPLMGWRLVTFRRKKWHFMCDLCYWVNLLCLVHLYVLPDSAAVFALAFTLSNGPLAWAIVAWRNSLVFHDLEKMTSIFIHAAPPLLMYSQRWLRGGGGASPLYLRCHISEGGDADAGSGGGAGGPASLSAAVDAALLGARGDGLACGRPLDAALALPLAFHVVWQAASTLREETCERRLLAADPEILTSLRWMARSGRGAMHDTLLAAMRFLGLMRPGEAFDASTAKTKAAFASAQFVYTVLTLLPTPLLYRSQRAHLAILVVWLVAATWNGASFYMEVFSRTYRQSIEAAIAATAAGTRGGRPTVARATGHATEPLHDPHAPPPPPPPPMPPLARGPPVGPPVPMVPVGATASGGAEGRRPPATAAGPRRRHLS